MLFNRGIPVEKQEAWLNAGWESIYDWMELNDPDSTCRLGKMQRAVNIVSAAIEQDKDILVVVDCDCDGMCSSALFVNYFYSRFPEYAAKHIDYILHDGKAHGLADICDKILSKKPALLVSPDGATNDKKQQKTLNDAGIDILILDHHEADADCTNEHTLVINVQLSEYPNKALTGGGVVYKFISAFEDLVVHGNQPTEFLDLAAIADIGDMADYREPEIRALVNLGLTNIKNPLLFALAQKNKYTIDKHGGLCYIGCAFGMVPFINACCRSGTMTEKELVLEAMLTQHAFEKVESSKRGAKGILVPLYSEAVTTLERIKRRQTDLEAGAMQIIQERIDECHLTDNAVIAVIVDPNECEASICGLAANKVQAKYQHPAMVLRRTKPQDSDEDVYSGSARNYSLCEIQDMKGLCASTDCMSLAAGHSQAFGAAIPASKFNEFISRTNELYKNIDFTPAYMVDYIWNQETLDSSRILAIGKLNVFGQEIPESLVAVEKIPLSESNVTLLGLAKGHPTIKVQVGNVSVMKFNASEEMYEQFIQPNSYLTIVGKPAINEWNGNISPQILIEDYELTQEWRF